MKKILLFLLSLIIIPLIIVAGIFFFSVVAVIIAAIIGLVILLSLVVYMNKKFKYIVSKIKHSNHNNQKTETPGHTSKRTGKEHEVVIEQIEEHIPKQEKKE